MPDAYRPVHPGGAGAARSAGAARPSRAVGRRWRRRGRRGQVAAVATILGLMLLVVMIANFLTTTLPQEMRVNEANHLTAVENQVVTFGAILEAATEANAVGAVISQTISLGSVGVAPIAPPSGGSLAPAAVGSQIAVSYSIGAAPSYTPIPQKYSADGGTLAVNLLNAYSPRAVVAFDQGAIAFAEPNGIPVLLVAPAVNVTGTDLTVWLPEFYGNLSTVVGHGPVELSARLLSVLDVNVPAGGYSLVGTTSVAVTTAYAAAWVAYFDSSTDEYPGLTVACAPAASAACTGPFSLNGALGTVYLNMTTAVTLALEVGTFSIAVD